jgi:hypothetical protein
MYDEALRVTLERADVLARFAETLLAGRRATGALRFDTGQMAPAGLSLPDAPREYVRQ